MKRITQREKTLRTEEENKNRTLTPVWNSDF